MPISDLDPRALRNLTPAQIADLALAADQESRRQLRAGNHHDAAAWDRESDRLASIFRNS